MSAVRARHRPFCPLALAAASLRVGLWTKVHCARARLTADKARGQNDFWDANVGSESEMSNLSVERVGSCSVVTMRRADRRNALSLEMMRDLEQALAGIGEDRTVRVVILAGEGPAFSAGHDLRELRARDDGDYREIFDQCVTLMQRIESIPQPVIAEVDTVATAAGCQVVATCDLAVASTNARFATPGVRIGLFCSTPMVALSRAVGRKRAMEMLLTGEMIDAGTALEWGLVNRVVPPEELRATTLALAEKVAEASGEIVALGKAAFYAQVDLDERGAYAYTKDVMVRNAQLENAQEGIGAFIEKRRPVWLS
ncbi:MAG TPA: enoyl-CoA hydratase [Candidatus Aquilonibacter sp.]|nr:enoyl-CoA hydratase [Candidatus Aquilonibacter sp.]